MMVEGKTRRRGDQREVPATCRSIAPTGSNPVQHRRLQYFQAQFAGTYTTEHACPHESTHNSCATSTREVGGSARRVRSNLAAASSIASHLVFYSDNRAALRLGLFGTP